MASDDFTEVSPPVGLETHDSNWGDVGSDAAYDVASLDCVTGGYVQCDSTSNYGGARYTTSSEVLTELVVDGGSSDGDTRFKLHTRCDGTNQGYEVKIIGDATNWNYFVFYKDGSYTDEGSTSNYARSSQHTFTFSSLANGANRDILLQIDSTTEYSTTDSSSPISRTGNPGFAIEPAGGGLENIITSWNDGASAVAVESIPAGTLELIGIAPSTLTVVPVKPESIPVGTLELIGIAPGTATVSTLSAEGIPVGTLTLIGFAPHPETNDYSVQSLKLTGFAPAYSIQGVVSASIPVATFELIGFAPETLAVGLALEPIPAGTLTLTGFAPESQVTGGADEGIPSGTLELVGFAPSTVQLGTQSEGIPNNVIYLSSYAPGYNIPGQAGPRRKTGGKRSRPSARRIVIIGGQRHVVHSYTEERYLLERYLKRLQNEESQEEAPEVRKRPVKLVSRNISLTETRIAKLDQRVEWHRKKLRQEDDLLLSLFG